MVLISKLLLFVVGFLSSVLAEGYGVCPEHCMCYDASIVCRHADSSVIPKLPHFLPEPKGGALQHFIMTRTKLNRVPCDSFVDYQDLIQIDLSNNEIEEIDSGAFSQLPQLTQLSLRQNKLTMLPDNFMEEFANLEDLNLAMNKLTKIPLSIERMISLRVLNLNGNPIHCPCSIIDLALLLIDLEPAASRVSCAQPEIVRGETLHSIAKAYKIAFNGSKHLGFTADTAPSGDGKKSIQLQEGARWPLPHCAVGVLGGEYAADDNDDGREQAKLPSIVSEPMPLSASEGERALFMCRARGKPTPRISWIIPTNETKFVRMWDRRRVLEIKEIHAYHEGAFTCVAENENGWTEHAVNLQLIKLVKPQIVQAPMAKMTGKIVGDDLHLVCAARGRPRPSLNWLWMRTTTSQRLSTEGRYVLRPSSLLNAKPLPEIITQRYEDVEFLNEGEEESLSLTIRNVTERDIDGRYICYASNRAGSARVSSVISLTKPLEEPMYTSATDGITPMPNKDTKGGISETSEDLVKRVIEKARRKIDSAIQKTAENLRDPSNRRSASDIASLFRQPSKAAVELAKAAEVYEAALDEVTQILQKQHQEAIGKDEKHIYQAEADFDEQKRTAMGVQLSAEQLAILAQLSGCAQSQRVEPCDRQLCFHLRYRSIDGGCNNLKFPRWGAALAPFYRVLPPVYENGVNTPVGWSPEKLYFGFPKPSARLVSYELLGDATKLQVHTERLAKVNEQVRLASLSNISQKSSVKMYSAVGLPPGFADEEELFDEDDVTSGMLMQWGQFLDHDLDFTPVDASTSRFSDGLGCNETCINDPPCFPILTPPGDPRIRQRCTGFARSSATCGSGSTSILLGRPQHREQLNQITAFIDASNVYGSEDFESRQLRDTLYDEGKLREGMPTPSGKKLLPFNIRGQVDCQADPQQDFVPCFKAGDHRNNENLGLISMHTIWMREHNRLADGLRNLNPHWSGDRIYQEARKIVGACMQSLTYRIWLPKILGEQGMQRLEAEYSGYDASVNPTISNEFATAAFRFGHTLVSPILFRLNEHWEPIPEGHLLLHQAFFAPERMLKDGGLDPILRGLIYHGVRDIVRRPSLNPELTERLFAMAHQLALDLASLNVQRGRDHGLQHYTAYAFKACGLGSSPNPDSFDDLADRIRDPTIREKLRQVYGHPGNIDLFVGGILEDVLPGARMGPTFACLIADQFKRLRVGDRLWYESPGLFTNAQLAEIRSAGSLLSRVICENADNITEIPFDSFQRPKNKEDLVTCDDIPKLNLALWKECPTASGGSFGTFSDTGEFTEEPLSRVRRGVNSCPGPINGDNFADLESEIEQRLQMKERELARKRR